MAATMTKKASLLKTIEAFMQEVDGVTKQADEHGKGNTSHPSESVDDGNKPVSTGSRAAENEADVKKQIGPAAVDNTTTSVSEGDKSLNLGLNQSLTGEDPATEDNYKDKPEEPGTSHPAKADMGEKYSSMSFKDLCKTAAELSNGILASIATAQVTKPAETAKPSEKPAAEKTAAQAAPVEAAKVAEVTEAVKAAEAGYDLAALLGGDANIPAAQEFISDTIKVAAASADLTAQFIYSFHAEKLAQAQKAAEPKTAVDPKITPKKAANDVEAPPEDNEMLNQMAGGGMPSGGDVLPGGEVPPGGDVLPGGGSDEAALEELAAVLQELGITPEQLLEMLTAKQAAALVQRESNKKDSKVAAASSTRELLKNHILEITGRKAK